MYLDHFGLTELPFGITPDTSYTVITRSHQEALNTLLIALGSGEGFIKITGEVGTGKTLLCRRLLQSLPADSVSAYLPNPFLAPRTLLLALAEELALEVSADSDDYHLLQSVNRALVAHAAEGRQVVVCIDEAQAMPLDTMEALRLLTNLETEKNKLLQVVIFGQPELDEKLDHPAIRQLKQRITFDYRLDALTQDELHFYLNHRLIVAGYQGGRMFSRGALAEIRRRTRGVPRLVNILAHKALLAAYGKGRQVIARADVVAAARDTGATRVSSSRRFTLTVVLISIVLLVIALAAGVMMYYGKLP